MPIDVSIPRKYPDCYAVPKKFVLVLSCVDYRLLDDLIRFLDHDNLANRYYHATFAGAALGLVSPQPEAVTRDFSHWRRTFIEHVQATVTLTDGKLTDIYIVQHENCGAFDLFYRGFKCMSPSAQFAANQELALLLQKDISENFCELYNAQYVDKCRDDCEETDDVEDDGRRLQKYPPIVHAFFMDLRGNVERLSHPISPNSKCPNHYCEHEHSMHDVNAISSETGRRAVKKEKPARQ